MIDHLVNCHDKRWLKLLSHVMKSYLIWSMQNYVVVVLRIYVQRVWYLLAAVQKWKAL